MQGNVQAPDSAFEFTSLLARHTMYDAIVVWATYPVCVLWNLLFQYQIVQENGF